MCLTVGGITVSAEANLFAFSVKKDYCDANVWKGVKDNNEQTAYVTPITIMGEGRIWAELYDMAGRETCTTATGIEPGEQGTTKSMSYYITGVKGNTYQILGCDTEGEITSDSFYANGTWKP